MKDERKVRNALKTEPLCQKKDTKAPMFMSDAMNNSEIKASESICAPSDDEQGNLIAPRF